MTSSETKPHPTLADPHAALASLLNQVCPVESETCSLPVAAGRVLAEPIFADRPSPASDVSAMDGYAVRVADLCSGVLPIDGEVAMGSAPPALTPGCAMRIFTGGALPDRADAVIRREAVTEQDDSIGIEPGLDVSPGTNIRRAGENDRQDERVVSAGKIITTPIAAALASFGIVEPRVSRRVRLTLLTTGDEVLPPDHQPEPWQLRNSNTEALRHLFSPMPWLSLVAARHVSDELANLTSSIDAALESSDAVVLTGGVSQGDHDYVPDAIRGAGAHIEFHKLAIRPGKPVLGALGPEGQAIFGLPGNPVSVMTTARRFVIPTLRQCSGQRSEAESTTTIQLDHPDPRTVNLWWYRPVRRLDSGHGELVPTKGSGDPVGAARSDGFVEIPPGRSGPGPWPFYPWHAGAST